MTLFPLLLTLLQQPQPLVEAAPLRPYAMTDVHVVRVETGEVLRHQTLLIEGGQIVAMGSTERLPVPRGFTDLEVQGKYVTPGFVDAHAHFPGESGLDVPVEDYLRMMVANGITRLRCMRLEEGMDIWQQRIAMGQVVGPKIMKPIAMLTTRGGPQGQALDDLLTAHRGQEDGYFKMLGGYSEKDYRDVVGKVVAAGFEVAGHLPRDISLEVAAEAGQRGIEHMRGFDLSVDLGPFTLERMVRREKEVGSFHCPTLYWYAIQGGNAELEQLQRLPGIEQVVAKQREAWAAWWKKEEESSDYRARLQPYRARMLRILAEMGRQELPLLLSASDGDFVVPGYSIHEEIALFEEAGISPLAILQALTLNPARSLHAEGRWGRVAVGLAADLVVLEQDPRTDADALKAVVGTMVGGRWFQD